MQEYLVFVMNLFSLLNRPTESAAYNKGQALATLRFSFLGSKNHLLDWEVVAKIGVKQDILYIHFFIYDKRDSQGVTCCTCSGILLVFIQVLLHSFALFK